MGIIIFGIVAVLIGAAVIGIYKQKGAESARKAYQSSLASLSSDPTNPGKRKVTLALGRAYSSLTRNSKGVTVFDEIALMNDINAACGGAAMRPPGPSANSPDTETSVL